MYSPKSAIGAPSDVLSVDFSQDEALLAAACADGVVRVYSTARGHEDYALDTAKSQVTKLPATCLEFRPQHLSSRVKNMLVVGTAAGTIEHWHVTSKKCVHTVDVGTEVYCLSYREDGLQYAAGGKDGAVHIGSEGGKGVTTTLTWAEPTEDRDRPAPAHSSRVQSVKWFPHDQHMLISGGWDSSLQIWDTRTDHAVSSMFGAYLCGDAMVISKDGHTVYTASCRDVDQIQMWDTRKPSEPGQTLPMRTGSNKLPDPTAFYGLALSGKNLAAVGATGFLMYPHVDAGTPLSLLYEDAHPLFAVRFSVTGGLLAVGGAKGGLRLYEQVDREKKDEG
eukprot:Rhum_TRINITY_DN23384_c0_g1::Rhum_TRINITY_DN23384_c0_g1_i1::g.177842::m.177842